MITYSRIVRLEQWLHGGNQEPQVGVNLCAWQAIGRSRYQRSREHHASIAHEQVHKVDLAPLIHVDCRPAEPPVVLVQEVEACWTHSLKSNGHTTERERGLILQQYRYYFYKLWLMG